MDAEAPGDDPGEVGVSDHLPPEIARLLPDGEQLVVADLTLEQVRVVFTAVAAALQRPGFGNGYRAGIEAAAVRAQQTLDAFLRGPAASEAARAAQLDTAWTIIGNIKRLPDEPHRVETKAPA
jgi:hypothetical protein